MHGCVFTKRVTTDARPSPRSSSSFFVTFVTHTSLLCRKLLAAHVLMNVTNPFVVLPVTKNKKVRLAAAELEGAHAAQRTAPTETRQQGAIRLLPTRLLPVNDRPSTRAHAVLCASSIVDQIRPCGRQPPRRAPPLLNPVRSHRFKLRKMRKEDRTGRTG